MKTRILKTTRLHRRPSIAASARLLRQGKLVAFPTETVYGLGGSIFNRQAVRRIFRVKGRPSDNPLIVHVWSTDQVHFLARTIPVMFWVLAERFMPGPLTVVLRKSIAVPDAVGLGLSTIAVRMPDHPVARALLRESGVPVVAPSANLSGRPSPTRAEHVMDDLGGRIPVILDGGRCRIGLESTVLDLTRRDPTILRPGGTTKEQIEEALRMHVRVARQTGKRPRSPGMKYRHYSPKAELVLFEGGRTEVARAMREMIDLFAGMKRIGVMAEENLSRRFKNVHFYSFGRRGPSGAARLLFDGFRELDKQKVGVILCQGFVEEEIGVAVMNRLKKAAARRIRV